MVGGGQGPALFLGVGDDGGSAVTSLVALEDFLALLLEADGAFESRPVLAELVLPSVLPSLDDSLLARRDGCDEISD